MRRFLTKRVLFAALALLVLISVSAITGVYVYLNSPQFNERLRNLIVEKATEYTGTRVSIGGFHWSVRTRRLELQDLTFRGTEAESDPPLGHIESISAGIRLRSLLQRRVDLFDLQIVRPELRLRVDAQGRTNFPGPIKLPETTESRLTLSIDSLKVVDGKAIINDRQTSIDFDIKDLASDLRYRADTQTLSAQVSYSGSLDNPGSFSIPYTLASDFDFTQGTILAKSVLIGSGKTSAKFQGRIDKVLTSELAARLAYTGQLESSFLKHFRSEEIFGGTVTAQGMLNVAQGRFSTSGDLATPQVELSGWKTGAIKATYTYRYPEKQLDLTKVTVAVLDGTATGKISATPLPGMPRVTVDLDYSGLNAAQLVRFYPWDPKYVLYSSAQGHLKGWFEGRLERYEFEGNSLLSPYSVQPEPGIVSLPAQGAVDFAVRPGEATIKNADLRLFETNIRAQGKIAGTLADLSVDVDSPNLAALNFLYADANGKGAFKGTLKGSFQKPTLDGSVVVDGYKFREWTIRHAEGSARLDLQTQMADLKDFKVNIGESTATLNGTATLDGTSVNLRIQSDHVRAEDFASVIKENVSGVLSGNVTVTSLNPLRVTGRVSGTRLSARGHTLDTFTGDLTYNDPVIQIRNATASELGANLKAETLEFNSTTGVVNLKADVSSLTFNRLREFGVPETIGGTIRQANLTVSGTQARPQIDGTATIENLMFRNETFPLAQVTLSTTWPRLKVTVSGLQNVNLSADIDLSTPGYRFKANADFTDYSVEKLANFSGGMLTASGEASIDGELKGQAPLSGKGVIRSIQTTLKGYAFQGAKPFPFEFDANRLTLTDGASFNGAYRTSITLKGSIGLTNSPPLDLRVTGNLDLSEVTAAYEEWSVTGIVKVDGQIGGTSANPTISGNANISNGSLGREGVYTTLSALTGDVRFNENRVTFDNLEGRVGGGTVRFRGNGLMQNSRMEGLSVRIDVDQVRLRYPAGLRSSVTGSLSLRGTSDEPTLEGNLRLDSLAFRSDFEPFLAVFRPGGLNSGGTMLDHLRLSIHVAGNRNIIVQNELTDISAGRIDLDIKGTLGSPSLTGHVEATEGTLLVQGKRYEVTRGNIDFVDPFRIEPVVDIQAEAEVRDYRVILAITGKGDRIRLEFRSDPPLSQMELVSLIAGGKTREELERANEEAGRRDIAPTSEELFQGGAASILTELLRTRVGNRFGLMGLDWIRFDLPVEAANSNPSLRVTLSQQVNKDLSVTYSQDLATSQQRLVLIEYFLTKNLSIVASREEANERSFLSLDVKLRKRF